MGFLRDDKDKQPKYFPPVSLSVFSRLAQQSFSYFRVSYLNAELPFPFRRNEEIIFILVITAFF